jgi:hypothetical protein
MSDFRISAFTPYRPFASALAKDARQFSSSNEVSFKPHQQQPLTEGA